MQNVDILQGKTSLEFVEDVANIFIECAYRATQDFGSRVYNMRGDVISSEDFLEILIKMFPESKNYVSISKSAPTLPFPFDFDQSGLNQLLPDFKRTSIEDGILKTWNHFKELHEKHQLHNQDLKN